MGIVDALKLEEVQLALLRLYAAAPAAAAQEPDAGAGTPADGRAAVLKALGNAMQRLLVDLHNHVTLLGAPSMAAAVHAFGNMTLYTAIAVDEQASVFTLK